MEPKISVIIPIYNVEKYLIKCVMSVINSSYRNTEIVLINDGSTDGSKALCDRLEKEYENIILIDKENGGLSSARNIGLNISTGEYVLFVDSDDYILKDLLMLLMNKALETNADVVQASFEKIDEEGETIYKKNIENIQYEGIDNILKGYFIDNNIQVTAWGKLYKREVIETLNFMEGKNNEDNIFLVDLFEKIKTYACISYIGYRYLSRKNSIVKSDFSNKKLDAVFACQYMLDKCIAKWPNYTEYCKLMFCKVIFYLSFDLYKSSNHRKHEYANYLNRVFKENFSLYSIISLEKTSIIDKIRIIIFRYFHRLSYLLQLIFEKD